MQPTTSKLKLYNESMVQPLEECNLQCEFKGEQHVLNFKIVTGSQHPLLSGETCTKIGLITVHPVNNINMSTKADVKNTKMFLKGWDASQENTI